MDFDKLTFDMPAEIEKAIKIINDDDYAIVDEIIEKSKSLAEYYTFDRQFDRAILIRYTMLEYAIEVHDQSETVFKEIENFTKLCQKCKKTKTAVEIIILFLKKYPDFQYRTLITKLSAKYPELTPSEKHDTATSTENI